jgi:Tfp pilus assembly protein PilW
MKFKNYLNNSHGFSLLELLVYMAILAGFLIVIVNLFFIISTSSAKEEARAEVRQNLRFAIEQIKADIRFSGAAIVINAPTSGGAGNTLNFTIGGTTTDFSVASGVLQRTRGAVTQNITTDKVAVSVANSIFTRIDNVGAKPTIQIVLTMSYNDNGRPDYKFFESVQTTVSVRQ